MARTTAAAAAPQPVAIRRELKMHKRLLWDVINKQAGSIEKAVLEAVMNSIDAGATHVEVDFEANRFSIRDDGKGFANESEILDFFDTFGFPHDDGDATYGRYRMGRGQLFSFGSNVWKSNQFKMVVNLKPQEKTFKSNDDLGLGYDLFELSEPEPGCSIDIELYDRLLPSRLNEAIRKIESFVKFAQIPIVLNGRQINIVPATGKWKLQTDSGYFNLKSGASTLKVYNLGVLVCDIPASANGGLGGEVVSKQRLDVNFARNDVLHTCKVWKAIQKTLREQSGTERKTKLKMTDADREAVASEILAGEMSWQDILEAKVLTDVTGAHRAIATLKSSSFPAKVVAVPTGDRRGEKAQTAHLCHVLSTDTLDRFGVRTTQELLEQLRAALKAQTVPTGNSWGDGVRFADMPGKYSYWEAGRLLSTLGRFEHLKPADLLAYFSDTHETIPASRLSKSEKVIQSALDRASRDMFNESCAKDEHGYRRGDSPFGKTYRQVLIGASDTAQAWTDGAETIWFNQNILDLARQNENGWIRLASILLHEYVHEDGDRESHIHDADFYKKVHDALINTRIVGIGVKAIRENLFREAQLANKSGKKFLKGEDRTEVMRAAGFLDGAEDGVAEPAPEADGESVSATM